MRAVDEDGDYVIYSYKTEIARVKRDGTLVMPDHYYSQTTARHQKLVRAAFAQEPQLALGEALALDVIEEAQRGQRTAGRATLDAVNSPLSKGASGPRVQHLQRRLSSVGKQLVDDGDFGDLTDAAVREFQSENGLKSDGSVGHVTRNALRNAGGATVADAAFAAADAAARPEANGARPEASGSDGDFGLLGRDEVPEGTGDDKPEAKPADTAKPEREAATQRRNVASTFGKRTLMKGQGVGEVRSDAGVKGWQEALKAEGYNVAVDGRFGPQTERATKRFQRRFGLKPDGIVGPKTGRTMKRRGRAKKKLEEAEDPVLGALELAEANAGLAGLIAKLVAAGIPSANAEAVAAQIIAKGELPTVQRGGERKARVAMKRLPDGTFAPAGQGQVLRAGQVVDVPHKSGTGYVQGVTREGGGVQLANGPDAGYELRTGGAAPSGASGSPASEGPREKKTPLGTSSGPAASDRAGASVSRGASPRGSEGDGEVVDVGGDVNRAADLLSQGVKVRLNQPREVSTLLDELARRVEEAKKLGAKAPNFDLCKVTVKNTNLFCAESKGIRRVQMPQLKGKPLPGSKADALPKDDKGEVDLSGQFRSWLEGQGVGIEDAEEQAAFLRASQMELNGGKVAGMAKVLDSGKPLGGDPRIFVSADNYVVDGHHRWAANVANDLKDNKPGDVVMPVQRVNVGIIDLLDLSNQFAAEWGIPQAGVGGEEGAPAPPQSPGTAAPERALGATVIGATPYRGAGKAKGEDYYQTTRYKSFENSLGKFAQQEGIELLGVDHAGGVWAGGGEPSAQIKVQGELANIRKFMDDLGIKFNQDAILAFTPDQNGPSTRYVSDKPVDKAAVDEAMADSPLPGATVRPDGRLEIIDMDSSMTDEVAALADKLDAGFSYDHGSGELRFKGSEYGQREAEGEPAVQEGAAGTEGPDAGDGAGAGLGSGEGEAVSFAGQRVALIGDDVPPDAAALLEGGGTLSLGDGRPDAVISRASSVRKRARSLGIPALSWNDVTDAQRATLAEAQILTLDPAGFSIYARDLTFDPDAA